MTFTPSRPCRSPGCAAIVASGQGTYCQQHRRLYSSPRTFTDRARGSAAERGYDATWQRARFDFLGKYPLCTGVLFPTEEWTRELAQQFHMLREHNRESGRILFIPPIRQAAKGSELCSAPPQHENRIEDWLKDNPIYRLERWDFTHPATVVDHIIPHKGDHELMWAEWNWQPLTKRAHDRKTAAEKPLRA